MLLTGFENQTAKPAGKHTGHHADNQRAENADRDQNGAERTSREALNEAGDAEYCAQKGGNGTFKASFGQSDASFAFNSANEIRYTKGVTYTALKFVDDMHILATDSDSIDMIYFENNEWKRMPVVEAAATVLDVVKTDNSYALTYLQSNVVKKLNFTFDGTLTLETNTTLFNNAYSSDWLGLDLVDGIVYFFNDDVLDNIYYLDLKKVDSRDVRTQTATRLGVFSDTDIIAMLESDTASTEE